MKQDEAQRPNESDPRPETKLGSVKIKKRLRTRIKAGPTGTNNTHNQLSRGASRDLRARPLHLAGGRA